jgi:ribosomal protein S24E
MQLVIRDKKENKALKRTEILCEVGFEKTVPSRKEIREAICASTGFSPELLVIVSITGVFGSKKAKVIAHYYQDKNALAVERKYLLIRDGLLEKKKKEKK